MVITADRSALQSVEKVRQYQLLIPRACSGLIESGGFPLGNRCASLSALIRLWEAVDGEGIFRGYAPAGYRAGGKWCFTAGGSGTLRSEPQHGGDLGEVLSRDWPMCRQTAWWEQHRRWKDTRTFCWR